MQRARFLADDAVRRLTVILGDTVGRDLRVARALAYGGSDVHRARRDGVHDADRPQRAEDVGRDDDDGRRRSSIRRSRSRMRRRRTMRTLTPAQPNSILAADSVIAFARVGAARASLNKNDKAKAIEYARWCRRVRVQCVLHGQHDRADRNRTYERHRPWQRVVRWRARRSRRWRRIRAFRARRRRRPALGRRCRPTVVQRRSTTRSLGAAFAPVTAVRIASYLEAQYIIAEAQGADAGDVDVRERASRGGIAGTGGPNGRRVVGGASRPALARLLPRQPPARRPASVQEVLQRRSVPEGSVSGLDDGADLQRGDRLLAVADERDQR